MTKRERKALGKYLRWIADRMGLRDWTLSLMHDAPDADDALASCHPTYGQKHARIFFAADIRDVDRATLRMVVVHELLHCHHAAPQDVVRSNTGRFLGQQTYDVFMDSFRMSHEYAIDGVAVAWSESFPLIEWPAQR